jgi:DNA-binding NtrC family response regulator
MSNPKRDEIIAVVNSNEDTVEMLRNCLQQHGFSSIVTGHIHDFKTGAVDFPGFLEQHDPAVIVYDVSLPYDRNWTFLRLLLDTDAMRGRKVVVTTTNKSRLEELVGATDAFEIVGKPYDLERIVGAVEAALGTRVSSAR